MKKIIRISLISLFLFLFINTINIKADSSLYEQLVENVSNSSTKHITYKTENCSDLHFYNAYIDGYIAISEKNGNTYLNLLLINKQPSLEVEIYFKESNKEYIKKTYDINGSTFIYGIDLSNYSEFSIRTIHSDILISVFDYEINSLTNILSVFGTITNGTSDFPENIINEPVKNKLINLIIVCGIVFCILLGLVIFVIVKAKKVNIRREEPYSFMRVEEKPVPKEEVIDVVYEEKPVQNIMPDISDPKYLTELYRKKLNNEITEKEFESALKRYQSSKHLEEDDD